jgi:2-oxoisovalerate dehydrogenase E1 component
MKGSTLTNGAATRSKGAAQDLLSAYRLMLLSRKIDDKEIQLKNQSQAFFQISGAGHEAVLVAAGRNLRPGHDWFLTYYRDRALALTLGVTPLDMLLGSVGAATTLRPADGRCLPTGRIPASTFRRRAVRLRRSACTASESRSRAAVRAPRGHPDRESQFERDEITLITIGEGSTSEGEFWESLNTACTRNLPVLYLVEDNGYAISTPVEVQTPGGDLSRVVSGVPNLQVYRCDGTGLSRPSFDTMREAVAHVRSRKGPALVHAKVIRPYSHSLSDDEKLYKTKEEREAEARRDPIVRLRDLILAEELASAEELAQLTGDVEREVNEAVERALAAPKPEPDTASPLRFLSRCRSDISPIRNRPRSRRLTRHDGWRHQRHASR